jgi:hypothetical protein
MEQAEYDDLLRRLTTLVVKLDERLDVQEEFNRQQVQINARLETLMTRVFQERSNGQEE